MLRCVRTVLKSSCKAAEVKRNLLFAKNFSTTAYCQVKQEEQEDMDKLKGNPFYAKYAEKLQKAQLEDPTKFDANVDAIDRQRKKELADARAQAQENLEKAREAAAQRKAQSLNAIMKLELLEDKTADEIAELWKNFHQDKDFIFAVIPGEEWKGMAAKVAEFPTFIYPIPRQMGYEFFLQQFDGHECHFTPVIAYQAYKDNAPSCLTITYYLDLLDTKGVVLMRGEPDTKVLSVMESQLLALQVKQYYGHQGGLKFNHVRTFNNSPDSFKHMDLIKEFEHYKKDVKDIKSGDI